MKNLAVLGDPVVHSLSPTLQNAAIKALGLEASYCAFTPTSLKETLCLLDGANITYPYKQEVLKLCTHTSSHVKNIGAVNTVLKNGNELHGYNTDWLGFYAQLENKFKSVLVLGSKGSAKAVIYALEQARLSFTVGSRGPTKNNVYNYAFLPKKHYDLVVNATPAGLKDDFLPCGLEILEPIIQNAKLVVDLNYAKLTPFLALAKSLNTPYKDGLWMLLYQGFYAFKLFFDLKSSSKDALILSSMKKALNLS